MNANNQTTPTEGLSESEAVSKEMIAQFKEVDDAIRKLIDDNYFKNGINGHAVIYLHNAPSESPDDWSCSGMTKGNSNTMLGGLVAAMDNDPNFAELVIKSASVYMARKMGL